MSDNSFFDSDDQADDFSGVNPSGDGSADSGFSEPDFSEADFSESGFSEATFAEGDFAAPPFGEAEVSAPEIMAPTLDDEPPLLSEDLFAEVPDTRVDTEMAEDAADVSVAALSGSDTGKRKGKAKIKVSKDTLVLGLHVTPKQVLAVLVRPTADGYEPLRQFVRNRSESGFGSDENALSPDSVGIGSDPALVADSDIAISFGGGGVVDFGSEFASLGESDEGAFGTGFDSDAVVGKAQPILFELKDILEECAQSGFARPSLAFAIGTPDVDYVEVVVPPEKKSRANAKKKKAKPSEATSRDIGSVKVADVKPDRLMAIMEKQEVRFDKKRVAFLPMTPRDGLARYMALIPTPNESVAESLDMLREQAHHRKTAFRTLQAEVPLLVGMAGMIAPASEHENTAIVRVGAEDTIVLLLSGSRLHHYELMQSVTAFDGPDTICSRVLLQQDVQGVGTVHSVIVMSDERERELVQGFAAFYPDATVETFRDGLARLGLVGPYGPLAPSLIEAAGAAIAGHVKKGGPFADTNLLPAHLMKRKSKIDLSFGWHTIVMAMLLFLSVLYFMYSYTTQASKMAQAEQRLAEFPAEARMSAPQLQARIDSLKNRQMELTSNLETLDSLLFDTDKWTQTLLRTTRAAASTGGVWIEQWQPTASDVQLNGYATTRGNVVSLAQRLNADIEEVTFKTVRDYPVYEYRIRFATPRELPQISRVMREQAGEPVLEAEPLAGVSMLPPSVVAPPPPPSPAPTPAQ